MAELPIFRPRFPVLARIAIFLDEELVDDVELWPLNCIFVKGAMKRLGARKVQAHPAQYCRHGRRGDERVFAVL